MAGKFEIYKDKGGKYPVPVEGLATARSSPSVRHTNPKPVRRRASSRC
jgi:hypothetical protein